MAVLAEKPLAVQSEAAAGWPSSRPIAGWRSAPARDFLFAPAYERLVEDVTSGRLERLDQVDIVLKQLAAAGAVRAVRRLAVKDSRNVLFEVGPRSFAHLAHLLGGDVQIQAEARDPVRPAQRSGVHRQSEIHGQPGQVGARLRFSFIDGYPEHYVHVRGSAPATVDFELST